MTNISISFIFKELFKLFLLRQISSNLHLSPMPRSTSCLSLGTMPHNMGKPHRKYISTYTAIAFLFETHINGFVLYISFFTIFSLNMVFEIYPYQSIKIKLILFNALTGFHRINSSYKWLLNLFLIIDYRICF